MVPVNARLVVAGTEPAVGVGLARVPTAVGGTAPGIAVGAAPNTPVVPADAGPGAADVPAAGPVGRGVPLLGVAPGPLPAPAGAGGAAVVVVARRPVVVVTPAGVVVPPPLLAVVDVVVAPPDPLPPGAAVVDVVVAPPDPLPPGAAVVDVVVAPPDPELPPPVALFVVVLVVVAAVAFVKLLVIVAVHVTVLAPVVPDPTHWPIVTARPVSWEGGAVTVHVIVPPAPPAELHWETLCAPGPAVPTRLLPTGVATHVNVVTAPGLWHWVTVESMAAPRG